MLSILKVEKVMILLQANQVARLFGDDVLFQNMHMEIQDRSRIALVGRNGTGKSTFLKILAKIEEPDLGTISTTKELTIGYLDQHTGLESTKTIWEEMLSVFDPVRKMEERLRFLEIEMSEKATDSDSQSYEQLLKD